MKSSAFFSCLLVMLTVRIALIAVNAVSSGVSYFIVFTSFALRFLPSRGRKGVILPFKLFGLGASLWRVFVSQEVGTGIHHWSGKDARERIPSLQGWNPRELHARRDDAARIRAAGSSRGCLRRLLRCCEPSVRRSGSECDRRLRWNL